MVLVLGAGLIVDDGRSGHPGRQAPALQPATRAEADSAVNPSRAAHQVRAILLSYDGALIATFPAGSP